jgi:superfamily II DNA or RNA helicase
MKHSDLSCFDGIIQHLKEKEITADKVLIFCRNVKTVGLLYAHFINALSEITKDPLNRIVAMFHRSTAQANKDHVLNMFPKENSKIRLLIATVAFGMGINIPDIRVVINYGAPSTIEAFSQESGRAGRDGNPSFSILLYSGYTLRKGLNDTHMIQYCKTLSCRSKHLLDYFQLTLCEGDHLFENQAIGRVMNTHSCCDNCRDACKCSECPECPSMVMSACAPVVTDESEEVAEKPDNVRAVDDNSLIVVRENLVDYQNHLKEEANWRLDDVAVDSIEIPVDQIVETCGYLLIVEDVLTHTSVTDDAVATDIIELIDEVIPMV